MHFPFGACLDIETAGLASRYVNITVISIYSLNGDDTGLTQPVGTDATTSDLLEALSGVGTIHTPNGGRFDLRPIREALGIDLRTIADHHDLMYDCWRRSLYGGFKAVERQPGIPRQLQGISGWDTVLLWQRYQDYADEKALAVLSQ